MTVIRTATLATPLGRAVAAATDQGICLLELGSDERVDRQLDALESWLGGEAQVGDHPHLDLLAGELDRYFAGTARGFSVSIHAPGTAFQQRVWELLTKIPFGETRTYRQIAESMGAPTAMRAVGGANGANRVSIVVPCHRVIGADGTMTGFGGGVDLKLRLLEHERLTLGVSLWSA